MNLKQALSQARGTLTDNNIEDASLEGEILLRHILKITRAQLFASLDSEISPKQVEKYFKLVTRRVNGEPTAYITGHREFYGLDFKVNRHVLIPRPETELLVEKAIALCRQYNYSKIADIGAGCGAIAVSLAVHLPSVEIYATDISQEALDVAKLNSVKHGVVNRILLLHGDLLEPLKEPVDLIIANLPYVRKGDIPDKGPLNREPEAALNGGEEGLDKIELLCRQAGNKLSSKGSLLLEIGWGQAAAVQAILHKYYPSATIEVEKDLAGIERVITLRLT